MPDHQTPAPNQAFADHPGRQTRELVLLGAGRAHLEVMARLAANSPVEVRTTLVAPYPEPLHSDMLPGFVAGHYALQDCVLPLEPLVRHAKVHWLQRSVTALDAPSCSITLDDGNVLHYDGLSVDLGWVQNRSLIEKAMPGAREHGLFVHPMETFGVLWPQVVEMGLKKPLRITVIGAGAMGVQLSMAMRHRLPNAAITIITGSTPVAAMAAPAMQRRIWDALKQRNITVLQDTALALNGETVQLGCGAHLACDVPLITIDGHAASWLADSGLALDAQGWMAVDALQRSASHTEVFTAAGASNCLAALAGTPLASLRSQPGAWDLLDCGNRHAIASWGKLSAQGRWVWWLKRWWERRWVQKHRMHTE